MAKKAMNGWRPKKNFSSNDEESPQFAPQMEENGGPSTDGETETSDRKYRILKVFGSAERTNEATSRGRSLARCEG